MTAAAQTFADTRDFVIEMGGGECCISMSALEMLMQNCLQNMADTIAANKTQSETKTITLAVGQSTYDIPQGMAELFSVMAGNCDIEMARPPCIPMDCPSSWSLKTEERIPLRWWLNDGGKSITFDPAPPDPIVVKLRGLKAVDCTLFTLDGDGVKNWKVNPLPAALHTAYSKCVYGMSLLSSDPGQGKLWMGLAADEVETWMSRPKGGNHDATVFVVGGTKGRNCKCRSNCGH
jgi:hypothetical protein